MSLLLETVEENQSVLIVSRGTSPLVTLLKEHLKKFGNDIFFSSQAPQDLKKYDYCFFINEKKIPTDFSENKTNKLIYIFLNEENKSNRLQGLISSLKTKSVRVVNLLGDEINPEVIDKILWFSFSMSNETHLTIRLAQKKSLKHHKIPSTFDIKKIFTLKRTIVIAFILVFLYHLSFIPFLAISSFSFYKGAGALKNERLNETKSYTDGGGVFLKLAQNLYSPVRPVFLFFSLALPIDSLFDLNDKARNILTQSSNVYQNSKELIQLILKKDKTSQEKSLLQLRLTRLKDELSSLEGDGEVFLEKIPQIDKFKNIREGLATSLEGLAKLKRLLSFSDSILAKNTQKTYLLLFANDKELRPGGGFIGSFGTVTFKDYTLEDLKIYDVYDADGQLIAHVDPPDPIRKYLNQPHWFLRDSAFSPDFLDNYAQAKFFLDKEMGMKDFSGTMLLTTSSIQNILGAFGEVYLSDFQEKVNAQNFYLKAEIYAEKNFFPGSIQKKSFLSSLTRQLMISLDTASIKKLAFALKKSLDEKQLVMYLDDPQVQEVLDQSYWSGRLIQSSSCSKSVSRCFTDYLFPIDANLGVNKANFFVTRLATLRTKVDSQGVVNHAFTMQFKNDSAADVFPGGTYSNYFQVLIPLNSQVKSVTKDGVQVDEVDEKDDVFKSVGMFITVPPKKTVNVRIDYTLNDQLPSGNGAYQLIVQKQIGSTNNDLTLDFNFAKNINIIQENISALVKDNHILYNTNLTADKIFFIELKKN